MNRSGIQKNSTLQLRSEFRRRGIIRKPDFLESSFPMVWLSNELTRHYASLVQSGFRIIPVGRNLDLYRLNSG